MTPERVLTIIGSAVQYLIDRGEIEAIDDITPKVRYTDAEVPVFTLKVGRETFYLTCEKKT